MLANAHTMGNDCISCPIDINVMMPLLMEQQRFLADQLGVLFPTQIDSSMIERVLDVACGPGGWVLDVAYAHRDLEVVGLDCDVEMIQYARAQARCQHLDNALFATDDMMRMSEIDDSVFQLVHARFIADTVRSAALPKVMKELVRVCSPGGTVLWVEGDLPVSSCPDFQQWQELTCHAATLLGQTNGVTPTMELLLHNAGMVNIQKKVYRIDFSAFMPANIGMYRNADVLSRCMRSLQSCTRVMTKEEIEQARQHMLLAMLKNDFCASMSIVLVWGQKPV